MSLFGFVREPGKARGYVADGSNPDYTAGTRLSRRQFDKYVERLGRRTHLPGVQAIRETDRLMERIRRDLEREQVEETEAFEEQAALLQRRREIEASSPRLARVGAGTRRYKAAISAWRKQQAAMGHPVSYRQAQQSPEFKRVLADLIGAPNKSGNPARAAEIRRKRSAAIDALGGSEFFRREYTARNGGIAGGRPYRLRGVNNAGRSTGGHRRAA